MSPTKRMLPDSGPIWVSKEGHGQPQGPSLSLLGGMTDQMTDCLPQRS